MLGAEFIKAQLARRNKQFAPHAVAAPQSPGSVKSFDLECGLSVDVPRQNLHSAPCARMDLTHLAYPACTSPWAIPACPTTGTVRLAERRSTSAAAANTESRPPPTSGSTPPRLLER